MKRKTGALGGAQQTRTGNMDAILQAVREDVRTQALATGYLRTSAELRTVKAGMMVTYIGPSDAQIRPTAKSGGTECHTAIKKLGKKHNLGSPHKYTVQKLPQYLFEGEDTTPEEQACLTAFAKEFPDVHAQGARSRWPT